MRLKKAVAITGSIILLLFILVIYSAKDLHEYQPKKSIPLDVDNDKLQQFEAKIRQLEDQLHQNHNAVHEIKVAMNNLLQPVPSIRSIKNYSLESSHYEHKRVPVSEVLYDQSCPFQVNYVPHADVQMLDLYDSIPFDNIDGGVWKQGWKIEVDEKDWNRQNKLKVFVVPHSHNDPGWIRTIEEYYLMQTEHILDNMLHKLPEDPRRKFIWAEISFFSMWWDEKNEEERESVKRLIHNNQLEFVTGGWVMNDEANSHWISIIHQLTEGHQWLEKNLNYTPISHWDIDPFGYSATQPFLLREMGLQNALIQRTHYSVKKRLAKEKKLEFRWRQLWDGSGKTELFTHMMPFYSYDVPHTCGPDPKICCQFDFKRLPHHGLSCPWRIAPQVITEKNVAQRAELLLDQYRKKSKLYRTNILLVPLGDDFRFDHPTEWDVQYENYQKLFDHMNSNLKLNVQAQFGTLTDYFAALHKEKQATEFPILSGDFFTYADRDDHYWSGYYTSRPFYKRMDRVLLSYVRAAEMIYTQAHMSGYPGASWIVDKNKGLDNLLTGARQSLSLFQHHDGITGTAKDHVVIDYAKKMLSAISSCQRVIQICTHILLKGLGADEPSIQVDYYNIDDIRHSHDVLPEHYQITIGVPELRTKRIVIFNPLTFTRHEAVTFHVSTPYVEVLDFQGKRVKCQVSPVFEYASSMSLTKYQLSFIANIPALGLVTYTINAVYEQDLPKETTFSKVIIYNHYGDVQTPAGFKPEVSTNANEFTLQNARVTASFNKLGLLKALKVGKNTVPVHLEFAKYGVASRSERSGAYLFLPDGDATPLEIENVEVNIIEGPILSSVFVQLPYVQSTSILYNTPGADGLGIEIHNTVDIKKTNNFELVMRLSTNINNTDEFFTDLNGYQILKRKRLRKLPLQANYYPIPSMAFIEDKNTRLTIVTSGPLGCSSLASGQIEVMLDRRLNQDDNLGVGQGVLDNIPTRHIFRILLEKRTHRCEATTSTHPAAFPSLSAYVASQSLMNPMVRLLRTEDDDETSKGVYSSVEEDFGVDISLPSLRSVIMKGKEKTGMVLHRQFVDICFSDRILLEQFPLSDGTVNISGVLPINNRKVYRSSLSFMLLKNEVNVHDKQHLCPMELQAFVF